MSQLHAIRDMFPTAIIALSPSVPSYDSGSIAAAVSIAREVGGPVMFPLNAHGVTPDVVTAFRRGGRVAIWNNPDPRHPLDIVAETAKFRSWGVDGMIDLRN